MPKNSVFRNGIVIGILILFVGTSVGANVTTNAGFEKIELEPRNSSTSAQQNIVYVNNNYTETNETHFKKIQAGVNAVNDNGTVYVCNGTYYENVDINKSLNLIGIDEDYLWGNDRNGTIINASGVGNVIHITTPNGVTPYVSVSVKNFIIQNSGGREDNSGIHLTYSNNCYIYNNELYDNKGHGIFLQYYANNTIISKNQIYSCEGRGILIRDNCYNNHILNNIIYSNSRGGILVHNDCRGITIKNNTVSYCSKFGILLEYGINVIECSYNRIFENNEYGLGLWVVRELKIMHNEINKNKWNLHVGSVVIGQGSIEKNNFEEPKENNVWVGTCFLWADHNWWGNMDWGPHGSIERHSPLAFAFFLVWSDQEWDCTPPTFPYQLIEHLIDDIAEMNIIPELENSLTQLLMKALRYTVNGDKEDAIKWLEIFIDHVKLERGKKLTEAQADYLIAAAQAIIK